ncbi:MAG: aminoacyl--tRNA ligase-related protein [Patescibacteria group bacterium]
MKQSFLFTKTRREAPKDEVSKNAQLLIRAGYIHKEMAGVYSYLPLGLKVLNNIENVIREEMNAIEGQEVQLTALQDKNKWEAVDRWDDKNVDVWFKTKLKNDTDISLAYTHEPAITVVMKDYITSYRDLPQYPYQFQTKFRNETRAKSGIFRGREFLMKDLYSFSKTQEELDTFYEKAIVAYKNIFNRVGLGDKTYLTLASGGSFGSKYSHEFQTLTGAGEDNIYIHKGKNIAINDEVYNDETLEMLGIKKEELIQDKSVEVGNIYKLGTFYSGPLELKYTTSTGESKEVIMGSYGIGLGRVMGTIVEVLSDEKGIVWPESIAPFKIHLILLGGKDDKAKNYADELYKKLSEKNVEVLYDDRDARAGEKFADSDLIGIPYRVIVSDKGMEAGKLEMKVRKTGEIQSITEEELFTL